MIELACGKLCLRQISFCALTHSSLDCPLSDIVFAILLFLNCPCFSRCPCACQLLLQYCFCFRCDCHQIDKVLVEDINRHDFLNPMFCGVNLFNAKSHLRDFKVKLREVVRAKLLPFVGKPPHEEMHARFKRKLLAMAYARFNPSDIQIANVEALVKILNGDWRLGVFVHYCTFPGCCRTIEETTDIPNITHTKQNNEQRNERIRSTR